MYKILLTLGLIFLTYFEASQAFYGSLNQNTSDFKNRMQGNKEMTLICKEDVEEQKKFEKTFILNFDKNASIYKKRKAGRNSSGGGMKNDDVFTGGGGTYYKMSKIIYRR
jgi:hypothetical protein